MTGPRCQDWEARQTQTGHRESKQFRKCSSKGLLVAPTWETGLEGEWDFLESEQDVDRLYSHMGSFSHSFNPCPLVNVRHCAGH